MSMTQNIYDSERFFEGYSRLQRSVEGLAGAPEWPALRAMLPPLRGSRVVDLGCGFGWFCRWAADQGAADVLGLDVSEKMLARADRDNGGRTIRYQQEDLEQLALPEAAFDVAYSSLALHYVADLAKLLGTVNRTLVPHGRLVFSIEHPIYMAPRQPRWLLEPDGRRSWPLDQYLVEGERMTDWLAPGVLKHHRTLGTTLNLLIAAGFTIGHVEEWSPTEAQIRERPALAEERERPMFLLVAAEKTKTGRNG